MMIALVGLVDIGFFTAEAIAQGMTPYGFYLSALDQVAAWYEQVLSAQQVEAFRSVSATVAGLWFAAYVVQACILVFVALCVRWVFDRAFHRLQWAPFSGVDLSVMCVVLLIVGVVLYIVSMLPNVPRTDLILTIALNVLVVSAVPLFVQGAAVGKAVMNKAGLGFGWQLVLGILALISGLVFLVAPFVGLIDFWANFRKLERDDVASGKA